MIQPDISRDPAAFVAALQAGDPLRAIAVATAMLADRRPLGRQWQSVARFAASQAEWPVAIESMRRFVADEPGAVDRRLALAETLGQAGRMIDAVRVLEPLAATRGASVEVRHFLGVALIELGRVDEGIAMLRTFVTDRPGSGHSWLAIANARRFTETDAELATMIGLENGFSRAPAPNRAAWLYAIGKAYDDLGEHDRAFAAIAEGARLVAADRPYDAMADRSAANATIEGITPDWLAHHATDDAPGSRAIFVTGKPRSGTTLVERILSGHSTVSDGGEVNLLGAAAAAHRLGTAAALRTRAAVQSDPWSVFRARFAHLVDGRFPIPGRVVDKSLNTSRSAALLRLALPSAPLVWVRRDPLDTAWSSFRILFARGVGWSFDLKAMAAHHAIEDRLHAFWADAFGDRLLTIDYTDLVERPDAVIERLLRHVGAVHEPQVRDVHLVDRAVQTASVAQVRRPINRDGLAVAAPYRRHLQPYVDAYRALGGTID